MNFYANLFFGIIFISTASKISSQCIDKIELEKILFTNNEKIMSEVRNLTKSFNVQHLTIYEKGSPLVWILGGVFGSLTLFLFVTFAFMSLKHHYTSRSIDNIVTAANGKTFSLPDGSCINGGFRKHEPLACKSLTSPKLMFEKEVFSHDLTDVALNKPTISAPLYSDIFPARYGNDRNIATFFHSQFMERPWWLVDLQRIYKIFRITVNARQEFAHRHNALKFYVTEDFEIDETGRPNVTSIPLFSEQINSPVGTEQSIHEKPDGQCGRYIIIIRDVQFDVLEIAHVKAEALFMI